MKKIKLPVSWEVSGIVEVEANSVADAVKYFNNNMDDIPLPYDSEYVDGSFSLSYDEAEIAEWFNS